MKKENKKIRIKYKKCVLNKLLLEKMVIEFYKQFTLE